MSSDFDIEKENSERDVRAVAILESILELETTCDLTYMGNLGGGSFGDVLKLYDRRSREFKAAKVIVPKNVCETEILVWSSLDHKNILSYEGHKQLSDGTMILFMPLQYASLDRVIKDSKFVHNKNAFPYLRRWILETLEGVDYMHRNRMCHLDLKLDNVLISHHGSAMLCDFSYANVNSHLLQHGEIGVPYLYRPPELFQKGSQYVHFGPNIDAWSFGIMVVEAATAEILLNGVRECQSWKRDIRPLLELILHQPVFESLVKVAFPNYSFRGNELEDLLDFVDSFLRTKPGKRVLTSQALSHKFMQDTEGITVDMKEIFTELKLSEANNMEIQVDTSHPRSGNHLRKEVAVMRSDEFDNAYGESSCKNFYVDVSQMHNTGFVIDYAWDPFSKFKCLAIEETQAKFGRGKRTKKKVLFKKALRRRFRYASAFQKNTLFFETQADVSRENFSLDSGTCFEKDGEAKLISDGHREQNELKEYELLEDENILKIRFLGRLQLQKLLQKTEVTSRKLTKSADYKRDLAMRGQAKEHYGLKNDNFAKLGIHLSLSLPSNGAIPEDVQQGYDHRNKVMKSAYSVSEKNNYTGFIEKIFETSPMPEGESLMQYSYRLNAQEERGYLENTISTTCVHLGDVSVPSQMLLFQDNEMKLLESKSTDYMMSENALKGVKHSN